MATRRGSRGFSRWLAATLCGVCAIPAAHAAGIACARSVSVDGHGEMSSIPDAARLSMTAEATQPSLDEASAQVDRKVARYTEALRRLRLPSQDLTTAAISVEPRYQDDGHGKRTFTGYRVQRGISLKLQNVSRLGAVLQQAIAAGIDRIARPRLISTRAPELRRQALAAAATDARANARVLARTLGARLGQICTLRSTSVGVTRPLMRSMALNKAAGSAPQIDVGTIVYDASVQARFALNVGTAGSATCADARSCDN